MIKLFTLRFICGLAVVFLSLSAAVALIGIKFDNLATGSGVLFVLTGVALSWLISLGNNTGPLNKHMIYNRIGRLAIGTTTLGLLTAFMALMSNLDKIHEIGPRAALMYAITLYGLIAYLFFKAMAERNAQDNSQTMVIMVTNALINVYIQLMVLVTLTALLFVILYIQALSK